MKVQLEKFVEGNWCAYGVYDLSKSSDVKAYTEAVVMNSRFFKVRVMEVEKNNG